MTFNIQTRCRSASRKTHTNDTGPGSSPGNGQQIFAAAAEKPMTARSSLQGQATTQTCVVVFPAEHGLPTMVLQTNLQLRSNRSRFEYTEHCCHGSFSEGSLLTAADIRSGCRKAIGFGATSPPPEVWVPIVRSCVLRRSASTVQSWQAWQFEEHVVIGVFGVRRTCGHCSMDLRDGEVPNCRQ